MLDPIEGFNVRVASPWQTDQHARTGWTDEDARVLGAARYTSQALLCTATREDLRHAGLAPALIGYLLRDAGTPLNTFKALCGRALNYSETKALLNHPEALRAMTSGVMTEGFAKQVYSEIKGRVTTATKHLALNYDELGYVIDGSLSGAGQAKSSLYYAYRGARVLCAKAYLLGEPGRGAEVDQKASTAVHSQYRCPTLIEVLQRFQTPKHDVLILPLLSKSAAELGAAMGERPISDSAAARIALGGLAAIAGLSHVDVCHGDVKPSNILLAVNDEERAVLADLGACTAYGEPLTERTLQFGLGLQEVACLRWDLTSLAATIGVLCLPCTPSMLRSAEALSSELQQQQLTSLGCRLAGLILAHSDCSVHDMRDQIWEPALALVQEGLPQANHATFSAWWPTVRQ